MNGDVMIAVDPHKVSNTAAVLDPVTKTLIEAARFASSQEGYERLTGFARRWEQRRWAVEGCRGAGRSLAQRLVAGGPDDARAIGGRAGLHHLVQGAFFDVPHEPVVLVASTGNRIKVKPVSQAQAGKVAVREHHRNQLPRRLSGDDHLGLGDVVGITTWLPRWQPIARSGATADHPERHLVKRGQPTVAEDPAGLGPLRHRQDTWTVSTWRWPPITEGHLKLSAPPLHF